MIRIFIENMLLFLLPTLLYVAWVVFTRPDVRRSGDAMTSKVGQAFNDAPLLWLFGAGAAMILVTLIAFGNVGGGKPGQHYKPATIENGQVKPSHFE